MSAARDEVEKVLDFLKRHGPQPNVPLDELRRAFDVVTSTLTVPSGFDISETTVGGCPGYWVCPSDHPAARRVLLMLHGGGFMLGSAKAFLGTAAALARAASARVFVVDYRLAPEHPCPAALDDVVNVYRCVLEAEDAAPCDIGVIGHSAGGNLAMGLMSRLKRAGLPLPAAAALVSPWLDLGCTANSFVRKANIDPVLGAPMLQAMAGAFLQGQSVLRELEPLRDDLHGFPPLLIEVGSREVLLDDAFALAERASDADVDVSLRIWPGMIHDWIVFSSMLTAGRQALVELGEFFQARVSRS